MRPSRPLLSTLLLLAACSSSGDTNTDTARAAPRAPGVTVGENWRVGPRGIGLVEVGARLGAALPDTSTGPGCRVVSSALVPGGVSFLVVDDVIARVQVDSGATQTAEGARIGDEEARVRELYGERVTATPHKYTQGWRYLTVAPAAPADSAFRIVFETDGQKVVRYRAGRLPEVEWVENCG